MKRTILLLLALTMVLCCLSCNKPSEKPAEGSDNGYLYDEATVPQGSMALVLSSCTAKAGETVKVSARLCKNVGINGFSFCVMPPEGFTVQEEKILMEDTSYSYTKRLSEAEGGGVNFAWTSLTSCTGDREIASLELTVPAGMAPGKYEVKLRFRTGYDSFYMIGADTVIRDINMVPYVGIITVTD